MRDRRCVAVHRGGPLVTAGEMHKIDDTFQIFTRGGYQSGFFTHLTTHLGDGLFWDTSQLATNGHHHVVPEPAEWGIALDLALGGLAFLRRHTGCDQIRL